MEQQVPFTHSVKYILFHLISWLGNFPSMNGFRRRSGESIKNLWKLSINKNIGTSKLCEKVCILRSITQN